MLFQKLVMTQIFNLSSELPMTWNLSLSRFNHSRLMETWHVCDWWKHGMSVKDWTPWPGTSAFHGSTILDWWKHGMSVKDWTPWPGTSAFHGSTILDWCERLNPMTWNLGCLSRFNHSRLMETWHVCERLNPMTWNLSLSQFNHTWLMKTWHVCERLNPMTWNLSLSRFNHTWLMHGMSVKDWTPWSGTSAILDWWRHGMSVKDWTPWPGTLAFHGSTILDWCMACLWKTEPNDLEPQPFTVQPHACLWKTEPHDLEPQPFTVQPF
jgi:hypothetical protein